MIFGIDNRTQASSAFTFYPAVVQIISYFPDGSAAQGSGILVGYNDVLTAAHVVYDAAAGGYATSMEVTPARNGQTKPYGMAYGESAIVSSKWIANGDYTGDYGLITLDRPLGYYTGFADIAAYPNSVVSKTLFSYGYPGDLNSGAKMYYTSGSVDMTDANILEFTDDFDAKAGQSGSPVFYTANSVANVVGVVSYESYGTGSSHNFNAVEGFTSAITTEIDGWIAENDNNLVLPAVYSGGADKSSVENISLLYYAFLNREPDKAGLDFWSDKYTEGTSLKDIADGFFSSGEYAASAAGSFTNAQFVDNLYTGILGRNAEAIGADYWNNVLNHGGSRADVANGFVFSEEFETEHKLDIYSLWHRMYDGWKLEAYGNQESDILNASSKGDSVLYGFAGNDIITGSVGDDYLWGGEGSDTLTGGLGADFFAWGTGDGYDTITDFNTSEDYIRLRGKFDWNFGATQQGYLVITTAVAGEGLVLTGISVDKASTVKVIYGDLV